MRFSTQVPNPFPSDARGGEFDKFHSITSGTLQGSHVVRSWPTVLYVDALFLLAGVRIDSEVRMDHRPHRVFGDTGVGTNPTPGRALATKLRGAARGHCE